MTKATSGGVVWADGVTGFCRGVGARQHGQRSFRIRKPRIPMVRRNQRKGTGNGMRLLISQPVPPGTYFLQQGSQPIPAPGPAPEPPPGNQVLKYPSPWGNFSQRLSRALNAEKGVSKHRTVAARDTTEFAEIKYFLGQKLMSEIPP